MMPAPTTPESRRRIRVLVVDDSALVRKAITDALSMDPEIEVVGSACDPYVAREKILRLDPDVLTLDLEMPRMDGLTFLRILMEQHPLPVVVVSSLTQAGSRLAMEAMEAGAVDVLAKPGGSTTVGALADQLAYHVKAAAASVRFRNRRTATPRGPTPPSGGAAPASATPVTMPSAMSRVVTTRFDPRQLIVIGASTGGIEALRTVLPLLPPTMPPILIVQHISAYFSKVVAERLDRVTALEVREAEAGLTLRPGLCLIAPGDMHLAVAWQGSGYTTRLVQSPPVHHCRPAVDVLFRSAAEAAGPRAVAALLTGMGSDGALGMQAIRVAGGFTIAEDEKTCVVFGMPRKAIEMGVVDRVLPLPLIAEGIIEAAVAQST